MRSAVDRSCFAPSASPALLEAGRSPQVIGMSRLAEQQDGAFQDLERLASLRSR